jgi:hypothetical protein
LFPFISVASFLRVGLCRFLRPLAKHSMTDQRVDELREQLRALGYLDAGVDRFLLAPAGRGGGPVSLAIRASIRVGLLGGALLGPAAAIGVGARLPGLITGVQDAVVIALYLGVFFFLAITVTSFLVTVTATTLARPRDGDFARHATRIARVAGWVTSLACLLYLTLWWRNANAGFGWSAPVWTSFALVIAVAISLLLGHAQRVTTLAALASATGPFAALPAAGARSWRVIFGGGALAFAGAAILLITTASIEGTRGPDHPPLTVVGGSPLRVIAIDGFDPAMYDAFARDLTNRFVAVRAALMVGDTSDPARAWTTIATGVPPEVHGVHGIETRRIAGVQGSVGASDSVAAGALRTATDLIRLTRPSVASRDERRAKTVWEIAEDAGLRTAVVNWWATWPAPPGPGIVFTDRAVLRLEQGGALDAEVGPPALYEQLREQWAAIRNGAHGAASQLGAAADPAIAAVLARSAELDATIVGIYRALPGPARDLDVIYLPGLDIAQHALFATGGASTPSETAVRVDALRAYYGFLRTLLGSLLEPSGSTRVVVITQPGRVETAAPGLLVGYTLRNVDDTGPGLRDVKPARVDDIAPTLLQGIGIPLSRELTGSPLGVLQGVAPRRYVDTYGRPFAAPASREGQPLDREAIDRLRSLGYIK